MILRANLDYMWHTVIDPRRGTPYSWGGSFDPNDISVGSDCSGAVSAVIEALLHGPNMNWERQFWTGSFAGMSPGDVGPLGLICIPGPDDHPPDAAAIVAIRQGPTAEDSHMMVQVGGTNIEDGDGLVTGPAAADIHDAQFNQFWYLPGPILGDGPPPAPTTPLVAALKAKGFSPQLIRLIEAFSVVEGLNPAGNPTLGFTDAQLGGATDLQSHVDALAQQFIDRQPVAGSYPQGGTDLEQAQWIARVVGQDGSPSDWQGNPQPADYVQRVVDAMQHIPQPTSGDDMAAVPQQQWDDLYRKLTGPVESQSPFRALGEGPIWNHDQLPINDDGMTHPRYVEWAATLGDPVSLAVLQEVANGSVSQFPDRIEDIRLAKATLARALAVAATGTPAGPMPTLPTQAATPPGTAPPVTDNPPVPMTVPGSMVVKKSTVIHSFITMFGGGLAIATWASQSFADAMSPGIATAVSSGIVVATAFLDFLVKSEGPQQQ